MKSIIIDAKDRFAKRVSSTTVNRVTQVRIVESCPACNSMKFHVVIEVSKETPTLRCGNPVCDFEFGIFEFIELPG